MTAARAVISALITATLIGLGLAALVRAGLVTLAQAQAAATVGVLAAAGMLTSLNARAHARRRKPAGTRCALCTSTPSRASR